MAWFYLPSVLGMFATGVTTRIFDFATAMAGHWRAGLCQVNILRSAVFSGMSGSALADAAGMGAVEIRAMVDAGYRPSDAAAMPAVSAMSATFGPVIPPSIAAVLYACRASRHTRCAGATLFGAGGLLARSV